VGYVIYEKGSGYYNGIDYTFQGELFCGFENILHLAKIYKSLKVAERVFERLMANNVIDREKSRIVEVQE